MTNCRTGIALGAVEIDGVAPGRVVAIGEIGAEVLEIVPLRAEMVVDHVEDHRQAVLMGGVDQPLQRRGPAVAVLHGVGIDAVVAPVAVAGETGPPASARSPSRPSATSCGSRGMMASNVPSGVNVPTCNS